jgi:hypothetical protein
MRKAQPHASFREAGLAAPERGPDLPPIDSYFCQDWLKFGQRLPKLSADIFA